jgi:hypothetical protein
VAHQFVQIEPRGGGHSNKVLVAARIGSIHRGSLLRGYR